MNDEYLQLEAAKEHIRQLQELDETEFERVYSSARRSDMHNDGEQLIPISASKITSPSALKREQHLERASANDLAYDEIHGAGPSKHLSYAK